MMRMSRGAARFRRGGLFQWQEKKIEEKDREEHNNMPGKKRKGSLIEASKYTSTQHRK